MRTSFAARSAGFIHGHGPSSKARRAASIAATAVFVDASGTLPIALLGGGVDDLDGAVGPFGGPLAVDEQLPVPGHVVLRLLVSSEGS